MNKNRVIGSGCDEVRAEPFSPEKIADIDTEGKEQRAIYAVQNRDTIPSVAEQRGYVMSFDLELNQPVRIYDDGRRELCE